ncbi:MAG: hypothetical protein E4H25_01825 [Methanomassiliicoccus sp.]|nr:MAG: hypothetical protein E4H25_01825 [Methanomassiliicoccus sp.]
MNRESNKILPTLGIAFCLLFSTAALMFVSNAVIGVAYQSPDDYVIGDIVGSNFGRSIAIIDINNDNIDDLVMGAPLNDSAMGSVIVNMSAGGEPMKQTCVIDGQAEGDMFGWVVANVGDLDNDGVEDLAVGAPLADNGGEDSGSVAIFYGGAGFDGTADLWIHGSSAGDQLGYSLAAGGMINSDGYGDLIIGAPFADPGGLEDAGLVSVFYGGDPMNNVADKTFTGSVAGAQYGWSVSGGGSVDSDASLDMVVGAPGYKTGGSTTGAAYVIRNIIKTSPTTTIIQGTKAGDMFGFSVCMVHDMNNDAFQDIAIGAPYNDDGGTNAGSVSILLGDSRFRGDVSLTIEGSSGEGLGYSIASGDFRGDAYADLLVGAPFSKLNSTGDGRAYAYFGAASLDNEEDIILAPSTGAGWFGASVAVGGDILGDNARDFAVGDPLYDSTSPSVLNAGRVDVYSGIYIEEPNPPMVQVYVYIPPNTEIGLEGFTVTLESGTYVKTNMTNSDGYCEMEVIAGVFTLTVAKDGYISNVTESLALSMDEVEVKTYYPMLIPHVDGFVIDAVDGSGVGGASVVLYNGTTVVNSLTTPSNGSYSFDLPDEFIPDVGMDINLTLNVSDGEHYSESVPFALERNITLEKYNVSMHRFPVIGGTVRDAMTLTTIIGAVVEVWQDTELLATVTTNSKGVYSAVATDADVPDSVTLMVTADNYCLGTATIDVEEDEEYTRNFALQIDSSTPTSEVTDLPEYTDTSELTVSATASDAEGVMEVELWVRYGGTGVFSLFATDDLAPYAFDLDAEELSGDGLYEFYSIAIDFADNREAAPTSSDTYTRVDTLAPESAVDELSMYTTDANFTVSVTASDANGVSEVELYYQMDGGGWILFNSDDSDPFSWAFNTTLLAGDGVYEFYSIATDEYGSDESAPGTNDTYTIVDTVAPSIVIDTPVEDDVIADTTVTVSWTASDDESGLAGFDIRLDGGSWEDIGTVVTYDFESMADGEYKAEVRATDNAGLATIATVNFTVDTEAPTVTITSPEDGDLFLVSSVTVEWTVTDVQTSLDKLQVKTEIGSWTEIDIADTSYEFADLSEGSHTLYVMATDLGGLDAQDEVTVTVDTMAPTLAIDSPVEDEILISTTVEVEWTASDDGTGIDMFEIKLDSGSWIDVGLDTSYDFMSVADGSHTVYVRATDVAGWPVTESVTFTVNTEAPIVMITSPEDGNVVTDSSVLMEWDVTEVQLGIDKIDVKADSDDWTEIDAADVSYVFDDLSEGPHTLYVRVTDLSSLQTTEIVQIVVDTVSPTVAITSPDEDELLADSTVSMVWTAADTTSGLANMQVMLDAGSWVILDDAVRTYEFSELSDGTHTLYVKATDMGGLEATDSVSIEVDTIAPAVEISTPDDGEIFSAGTVAVEWTGSDAGSGVAMYEVRLDTGIWIDVGTDLTYDFVAVPQGSHAITVRATDNAGLTASDAVEIVVDTSAPAVVIGSPEDGYDLDTSSVSVTWTVTEAQSDVTAVEIQLDAGAWVSVGATTVTHEFTGVSDGSHTISVRVTNSAGLNGTDSVTVRVDTTAPSVSITDPLTDDEFGESSVDISWTGSDGGAGLAGYSIRVDGGSWVDVSMATTYTFDDLDDGDHTIDVMATDQAGNTATASVSFLVDTTMPTIVIVSPYASALFGSSSVTVTWSAVDEGSGLDVIEVRYDSTEWVEVPATTATYTFSSLPDGSHTLEICATDACGYECTESVTIRVDTIAPTLSITTPDMDDVFDVSDVTVSWTASDAGSGIAQVLVSIDGGAAVSLGTTATSHTLEGLEDGEHDVTIEVVDAAGKSTEATISFTIDTSGGISTTTLVIVGALIAVIVVGAAVMLMKRKKSP